MPHTRDHVKIKLGSPNRFNECRISYMIDPTFVTHNDTHPPKPRLTIRVGITGHRQDKLNEASVEKIEQRLAAVFAAIAASASRVLVENKEFYAIEPPLFRLVSGLAEGADRIAIEERPAGWKVEALLPFSREEYAKDFAASEQYGAFGRLPKFEEALSEAASVTELPTPSIDRDSGYAVMGAFLLRQIDLLIAVWDGKKPKPGGTGAVAKKAVLEGIPVIWIDSSSDQPPVRLETFDADGNPVASRPDAFNEQLAIAFALIFGAPKNSDRAGAGGHLLEKPGTDQRVALQIFFEEQWASWTLLPVYDALKRLCNGEWPRFWIRFATREGRAGEWEGFQQAAPPAGALAEQISNILLSRFIWADTLAIRYADRYRRTFVSAYLLGFLAVLLALAGAIAEHQIHSDAGPYWLAAGEAIEMILIFGIVAIVSVGRSRRWHERWLDYRILAETLRHMRFLAYLGEYGSIRAITPETAGNSQSWISWYIRSTVRELGLPDAHLDETYQRKLLDAASDHEIEDQIGHHRANHTTLARMDHKLHQFGVGCFWASAISLIVFVSAFLLGQSIEDAPWARTLEGWLEVVRPWKLLIAAGLPALGAAISGIRAQGDLEGSAERSREMVKDLRALRPRMAAVSKAPTLDHTADTLIDAARVLAADLDEWHALYGRKRLTLPS